MYNPSSCFSVVACNKHQKAPLSTPRPYILLLELYGTSISVPALG